ncbi:MAG: T9SS type A sorting domain-containing protein [Chloroflexota bacterium]
MKKINIRMIIWALSIAVYFLGYCQPAISQEIKVKPLLINYYTIQSDGKNLAALGDNGASLVSLDKGSTWAQWLPFSRGVVIKMKFTPGRIIAFNSFGEVSVSADGGKSWEITQAVDDEVIDITEESQGYYLRGLKNIYSLSGEFDLIGQTPLKSESYPGDKAFGFYPYYKNTICYFKDKLVAQIDSSSAIVYDNDLKIADTFFIPREYYHNDTTKFRRSWGITCDSTYLYFKMVTDYKKENIAGSSFSTYITEDLNKINKIIEREAYKEFVLYNNKEFVFGGGSRFLHDPEIYSYQTELEYFKDYASLENYLIVVGERNSVRVLNMRDTTLRIISEASFPGPYTKPIVLGDSSFFLNQYRNDGLAGIALYKSTDDGATITPTLQDELLSSSSIRFPYVYFDRNRELINFIGHSSVLEAVSLYTATPKGDKFTKSYLESLSFSEAFNSRGSNARLAPELQKLGDNFLISLGVDKTKKKYTKLALLDSSFNKIRDIVALDAAVDYYYAVDTLTYFVHCANMKDSASEVRYTTDAGDSWTTIAKYDPYYEEIFVKDVTSKGKTYIMLAHRNIIDNMEEIDIIDVDARYKLKFEEWSKADDPNYKPSEIRFLSDENFVYVTRGDKLYAYPDLLDKSGMRFRTFPTGGRVVGPITQYGKRFIATYEDDYNAPNLCILEPIVPLSASDEAQVERANYLYCFPPYPNPAKNEVRSLIYWDTSLDIEKDDISVYSIHGKVAGREDITIEKTMPYSGYLVWNCSRYEPGAYFIVIKHGDAQQMIKVMVNG